MNDLTQEKCMACEGDVTPLNAEQIKKSFITTIKRLENYPSPQ